MKIFRNLLRLVLFVFTVPSISIAYVITSLMELADDNPNWKFHKQYWSDCTSFIKFWSWK